MITVTDRVIVAITDNASAGRTLTWAVNQAAAAASQLVVVRAGLTRRAVLTGAPGTVAAFETADPALARAVTAARRVLGDARVGAVIDQDDPGTVLVRTAGAYDLLVVGAPTRSGWWARASTTARVIGRAAGPVVVVPAADAPAPGTWTGSVGTGGVATGGVGTPRSARSHVVVGVDGSAGSRAALEFAFDLAARRALPVVAVTVTGRTDYDIWFDDRLQETQLGVEPEAADRLAGEVDPWHLKHPEVPVRRALVAGDTATALRRVAQGAVLLVVGRSPHPGAVGSLARELAGDSPCPLAVVPVR